MHDTSQNSREKSFIDMPQHAARACSVNAASLCTTTAHVRLSPMALRLRHIHDDTQKIASQEVQDSMSAKAIWDDYRMKHALHTSALPPEKCSLNLDILLLRRRPLDVMWNIVELVKSGWFNKEPHKSHHLFLWSSQAQFTSSICAVGTSSESTGRPHLVRFILNNFEGTEEDLWKHASDEDDSTWDERQTRSEHHPA